MLSALVLLAAQSSFLRSHVRPLHVLASVIDTVGGVKRVRYREAEDLEAIVDEAISS